MAEFAINTDVVTNVPTVEVTLSTAKLLPLGRHRFRLIVIDDAGNRSVGDEVEVIVADQDNPTAILSAPTLVGFGKSFQLDGSKSFDVGGGKVTQYLWTYLGPAGSVAFPTGPVIAPTGPVIAPTAPVIAPTVPTIAPTKPVIP